MQRKPLTGAEPRPFAHFVNMNDPNAEAYFVSDIKGLEGGVWRWTGKKPTLQFFLETTSNLRLSVDYTVSGHTLKDTGPISIDVAINGQHFETLKHVTEGDQHVDKPVPPALLRERAVNQVSFAVTPFWTSPADGNILGIILTRAGFVQ